MWVDGDRLPALDVWRQRLAGQLDPGDSGPCRWRDNGELRYSLRSLSRYAPWIRRVHLVTHGQTPDWLDPAAEGLSVATHEDIFADPSVLPTFNSGAITASLHRLPDLADHYLFFNDDVMLSRPVHPSDFITEDGGTVVHVETWPPPRSLHEGSVVDRQLAFNQLLLGPGPVWMLAHSVKLFQRDRAEAIWRRWQPLFERTVAHRFRSSDDALMHFLYFNTLLREGAPNRVVENGHGETPLVRVGPDQPVLASLAALEDHVGLSFCVNDEVDDLVANGWLWDRVRAHLEQRFPEPSPFEMAPSSVVAVVDERRTDAR